MIKMKLNIQDFPNNHTRTMNYSFFAEVIFFMVQAENKTEHKRSTVEHESPTRTFQNVSDKLTSKLNYGTLRDLTELLDPYKGK